MNPSALLTNDPVHFLDIVTVATMAAFASKGRGLEKRWVDMGQREEEEEWTISIPVEDDRKKNQIFENIWYMVKVTVKLYFSSCQYTVFNQWGVYWHNAFRE